MKYFLVTQTIYNSYKIPANTKEEALQWFLEGDFDLANYFIESEEITDASGLSVKEIPEE